MTHTIERSSSKGARRWWLWSRVQSATSTGHSEVNGGSARLPSQSSLSNEGPAPVRVSRGSGAIEVPRIGQFLSRQREEIERSALVTTLVRGLAHALNHHLHVVGAQVERIEKNADDPVVRESIRAIRASTTGMHAKFERLLMCTTQRPGDAPKSGALELDVCLLEWSTVLQWLIPTGVVLETVTSKPVNVHADRELVFEALLQLVGNSVEANRARGGVVRIKSGSGYFGHEELVGARPLCNARPGMFGFLEVEDEGEGIDLASLPRVYDPFYTTRFLGRGLGLALVLNYVQRMQGVVVIESTPGRGTRARLLLPLSHTSS